jgi:hypothetical protein
MVCMVGGHGDAESTSDFLMIGSWSRQSKSRSNGSIRSITQRNLNLLNIESTRRGKENQCSRVAPSSDTGAKQTLAATTTPTCFSTLPSSEAAAGQPSSCQGGQRRGSPLPSWQWRLGRSRIHHGSGSSWAAVMVASQRSSLSHQASTGWGVSLTTGSHRVGC